MRRATKAAILGLFAVTGCFSLLTKTDDLRGPAAEGGSEAGTDDARGTSADAPAANETALVAYWAFDEDAGIRALDTSGHGHDGLLNAGAYRAKGLFGNAIVFDRDAGGKVAAKIPGFGTSDVTMTAWVKSTDNVSQESSLYGSGFDNAYLFLFFNKGYPYVGAQTESAYWDTSAVTKPFVGDDNWHHLALVRDRGRSEMRVFVDGVLESIAGPAWKDAGPDATDSFGNPGIESEFFVGSMGANPILEFGGTIDEVRVYARALADSEVAALAKRP
jgi:Concanavalin A-like lectin/glucanases superfamily